MIGLLTASVDSILQHTTLTQQQANALVEVAATRVRQMQQETQRNAHESKEDPEEEDQVMEYS